MKAFVLGRGESGMVYLYERGTWEYIQKNIHHHLEFVTDNDDPEVLKLMQELVNKDIEIKD